MPKKQMEMDDKGKPGPMATQAEKITALRYKAKKLKDHTRR